MAQTCGAEWYEGRRSQRYFKLKCDKVKTMTPGNVCQFVLRVFCRGSASAPDLSPGLVTLEFVPVVRDTDCQDWRSLPEKITVSVRVRVVLGLRVVGIICKNCAATRVTKLGNA
jgi:hypothetical protein